MASGKAPRLPALTPRAAVIAVAMAMLAAHLVVGALLPLTEDEAYYRLWSLAPAWGYFDHPPMVAWMTWAGRQIAGDDAFAVRLAPSVAGALTTLLTFELARAAGLSERVAARAAIWLSVTALMALGGQLAVPDTAGTLFWVAALCCAFRGGGEAAWRRALWWLGAGVAAGLACLSKYSALFLAPGILLWLALTPEGRRQLRTPWPWLAAIVAGLIFAPNIAWNAQHHWMTFTKQFGRVKAENGWGLGYFAKLLFDQFFLLNPLMAVFVGIAVWRRAAWPMLAIAAPFVAYLVVHSFHDEVQGQWPAPLYPLLAIAAAAAADDVSGWLAQVRAAAAPLPVAFYAVIIAFVLAPLDGRLPFADPGRGFRGWPAFVANVERARIDAGAAWVGAPTYGVAAQLAAASALHAPAIEFYERERYTFETPAERADFTKPGLIVVPARGGWHTLSLCFGQVQPLPDILRGTGHSASPYAIYRVSQPRRDIETAGCYRAPQSGR